MKFLFDSRLSVIIKYAKGDSLQSFRIRTNSIIAVNDLMVECAASLEFSIITMVENERTYCKRL